MSTFPKKSKHEWKFGHRKRFSATHKCCFDTSHDEIDTLIPGKTRCERIKRWFVRRCLAAEWICKASSTHLRSHGSVIKEQKRQLLFYPRALHLHSEFINYWKCFMVVVNIVELGSAPMEGVLSQVPASMFPGLRYTVDDNLPFALFRLLLDLLCCVDVAIHFFTGYYNEDKKEVELSHKHMALHYLKTKFFMGIITSFPTQWELFFRMSRTTSVVAHSLAMLKVFRLFVIDTEARRIANLYGMNFYRQYVLFVITKIVLFWYSISCLQLFVKLVTGRITEFGWLKEKGLLGTNMFVSIFLYDGAQIIYNMSLGSLIPEKSQIRVISQIFFWVLSQVGQIYVLARCIEFINASEASRQGYVRIQMQLKEFMRHRRLPPHIQQRILNYYEYHYQKNYFNEERIMSTISSQLRQEITMQKCRLLVENVDFFKGIPLTLLMRVVSFLRLETFMENDVVVKAGYPGNSMYFILSGTVAVYTQSGKEIRHLVDGAYFGEIALVSKDNIRVATVVAVETCRLYRLDRQDFNKAILPYPDLLDTIHRIANERKEDCLNVQTKHLRQMDAIFLARLNDRAESEVHHSYSLSRGSHGLNEPGYSRVFDYS